MTKTHSIKKHAINYQSTNNYATKSTYKTRKVKKFTPPFKHKNEFINTDIPDIITPHTILKSPSKNHQANSILNEYTNTSTNIKTTTTNTNSMNTSHTTYARIINGRITLLPTPADIQLLQWDTSQKCLIQLIKKELREDCKKFLLKKNN